MMKKFILLTVALSMILSMGYAQQNPLNQPFASSIPTSWVSSGFVFSSINGVENGRGNAQALLNGAQQASLQTESVQMGATPKLSFALKVMDNQTFKHSSPLAITYSVFVSTNNGDTWNLVHEVPVGSHVPSDFFHGFRTIVVNPANLTPFVSQVVKVKVVFNSQPGYQIYVCLDDFLIGTFTASNNLAATRLTGSLSPTMGTPATIKAVIRNTSFTNTIEGSGYTVKLKKSDGTELLSVSGKTIRPYEYQEVELPWTPAEEGLVNVYAEVVLAGDNNSGDNKTVTQKAQVMPEGIAAVQVGTRTNTINAAPLDFTYNNSWSQTIYYGSEIGMAAGMKITKIQYFTIFGSSFSGVHVKLYLANTEHPHISPSWYNPAEFTLVFDGLVPFPSGENDIDIVFDVPFTYQGENIIVAAVRLWDYYYYSTSQYFSSTHNSFANRTREAGSYNDLGDIIVPPLSGSVGIYFTTIRFHMFDQGGSASGIVTDGTNPVEGATVKVEALGTVYSRITDANGAYSFNFLPLGTFPFKVSKHGYVDGTANGTIVESGNSVVNMTLQPRPKFTVSGKVTDNSASGGVAGVEINLSGYENYGPIYTNATGDYTITGVYDGFSYTIKAGKGGYKTYLDEVEVNGANKTHDFMLIETMFPVGKVTAEKRVESNTVDVTWMEAGLFETVTYILDDDNDADEGFSINPGFDLYLGNKFEVGAVGDLTRIDIQFMRFTEADQNRTVTLAIFDENQELVYESDPFIPVNNNGWNYIEMDFVPYSGTFYAMVHWDAEQDGFTPFVGLDFDSPYAMEYGWIYYPEMEMWIYAYDLAGMEPFVCFIRANANEYGDVSKSVTYGGNSKIGTNTKTTGVVLDDNIIGAKTKTTGAILEDVGILASHTNSPITLDEITPYISYDVAPKLNPKNLAGYAVYRLPKDAPETEWTLLDESVSGHEYADAGFGTLGDGVYQYAVKAKYSGGYLSLARFSNTVGVGMQAFVSLNVITNSGDPVDGAVVKFINQDGDPEHKYEHILTGNLKTIEVWKGTYDISVMLYGFETYNAEFEIPADLTLDAIELIEIITNPIRLNVEPISDCDYLFTWKNLPPEVSVTLEAHNVWGDGTGYQMLLDADANEYGNTIPPPDGNLWGTCAAPATLYNVFEYKIPENAVPVCTTNAIVLDGLSTIVIPPGIYDYCIANPTPGYTLFIANGENGRKDNYEFELGKNYHFLVYKSGDNDAVTITISDAEKAPSRSLIGNKIYLDGNEIITTTDTEFTFTNVLPGVHTAGVVAVYGSGESEMMEYEFVSTCEPMIFYNVTVIAGEGGSAEILNHEGATASIEAGASVTVKATPDATYDFVDWTDAEGFVFDEAEYTFTVMEDIVLKANFALTTYEITFVVKYIDELIEGAVILFDGVALDGYIAHNVLPGIHHYTVSKEGYEEKSGEINVVADDEITIELIPLGISTNTLSAVNLYPNPFKDEIYVSSPELVKNIQIMSPIGQLLKHVARGETISTCELSSGIYFVVIEGYNGDKLIYKMIKK